ncbi:four helix bundle protein [Parafilimonas sp.]|uniref:four helix bundle protein n=1 Tax=Parafilimonas sp. TaxID=1969739 RepID=UPI0039E51CD1
MTHYKSLEAWRKSMILVRHVYIIAKRYPKEELFALPSQTKRAAVSVPANIAEGIGRNYKRDTIQFLHIARGSLYKLETLLNIAVMVEIMSENKFEPFTNLIDETVRILNRLIKSYETNTALK